MISELLINAFLVTIMVSIAIALIKTRTVIVIGIALHWFYSNRPEFLDIAIVYALINFIGTVAVLKLFSTGSLGGDK